MNELYTSESEQIFANEIKAIEKAQKVVDSVSISKDDLYDSFVELLEDYKNLYNQSVKMTRISDSTQRKLIKVQSKLEEQNNQINQVNDQLQNLNATKDKFFSIISHDLRNPISSVLLMVEMLKHNFDNFTKDNLITYIGNINDSIKLVHDLFENLHRWSQTQNGTIEFKPQLFDLRIVTERVFAIVKNHADNKSINLICEVQADEKVYGDPNMIETVIRNLTTNAIKFTNPNGFVKITLESQAKYDKITVEDNGVGMNETIREKLFKINEKISSKGTAKEVGTGLGLILSKEFIDAHKGKIWVESEVGVGTKFIFRIPKENTLEVAPTV